MRKLMWFTLGFGAACAWGAYLSNRYAPAIILFTFLLTAVLAVLSRSKKCLRPGAFLCAGLLAGIGWFWMFEEVRLTDPRELDGKTCTVTIRAADFSRETEYGYAVDGTIELGGRNYETYVYLNDRDEPLSLEPGDKITGDFLFGVTTDGEIGESTYYQGKGIFLIAYQRGEITIFPGNTESLRDLPAVLRHRIVDLLESVFPGNTAAFAKALLLGDGSDLTYETDTSFKVSGIRHIIAVSGLHVSILFSVIYLISGKRRVLTALLGIPAVLLFAAVAGFNASITRACIMQILMMLALLFDREYDPPTALSFAALAMLVVNPLVITSVSFQLSVGCMAGIFLFAGRIREWILSEKCLGEAKGKGIKARLKRWFAGSVSVTLGAMTMTTPLCAWYFGTISLVGVLTNLLTLWIVTYIFYGIILVCVVGTFWLSAARGMAWIISWGIRYVLLVAKLLAGLPVSAVYTKSIYIVFWLIFCYVLIAIFLCMKKKHPAVFAGCMVLGLCVAMLISWIEPLLDECRLTVLDVGQGQCILLQSDGRTYLVDCGGNGAEGTADDAAETLLSQGITRLDGMILTHFDSDHCGGAANLLTRVDADTVFLPAAEDESGVAKSVSAVTDGSVYTVSETVELGFSDVKLRIIPSRLMNSDNESGLCVLFQTENCAILITGDRDAFGERMLLREADIPDLDVLIVGHHGSKYSTCESLLQATKPETAIISVGENNPYGHPAQETISRLEAYGCKIYRTDLHGTIIYRRRWLWHINRPRTTDCRN